jgi:hypothetical protein
MRMPRSCCGKPLLRSVPLPPSGCASAHHDAKHVATAPDAATVRSGRAVRLVFEDDFSAASEAASADADRARSAVHIRAALLLLCGHGATGRMSATRSAAPVPPSRWTRIAMRARLLAIAAIGSLLCAGCATQDYPYPPDWSAPVGAPVAHCPRIAGRYSDSGDLAARCFRPNRAWEYTWDCDSSLTANLLSRPEAVSAVSVDIEQPNDNTIVVALGSEDQRIALTQEAGDFSCDSEGIAISHAGNAIRARGASQWAVGVVSTVGALAGMGGVEKLSRHFRATEDGSLEMKVNDTFWGAFLLVPAYSSRTNYVLWHRLPPANAAETPPPANQ